MKTQKRQANFRLPETLLDELREVAEQTDRPQSEIVREAVKEKIADLAQSFEPKREIALQS